MYVLGDGFTAGIPLEDIPISASLAAKTGAQVISPAYRLATEHPFPAALDDISAVARQIFTNNHSACIAGVSAGANLALALMHRLRLANQPLPRTAAL
ncbi:MAG: alpha/beta hydrolase [Amylibacter sp.]